MTTPNDPRTPPAPTAETPRCEFHEGGPGRNQCRLDASHDGPHRCFGGATPPREEPPSEDTALTVEKRDAILRFVWRIALDICGVGLEGASKAVEHTRPYFATDRLSFTDVGCAIKELAARLATPGAGEGAREDTELSEWLHSLASDLLHYASSAGDFPRDLARAYGDDALIRAARRSPEAR